MSGRIVLTGGGSAGHVVVNLALIPALREAGWEISYIGSERGIERQLIADQEGVAYYSIPTGKFRRERSMESLKANVRDVGNVLSGVREAKRLMRRLHPDIVFSKGGFVSVPVVLAAKQLHVPVIGHESDLTPGLANKIVAPFVRHILITFKATAKYLPREKAYYLGPLIRAQIQGGNRNEGLIRFGLEGKKPVLLVLGGSLGAEAINHMVWDNLDKLLETFDIVHGVGAKKGDSSIERPGYRQVDYIQSGMNDALKMADLIVSRAGSNAIFEFLYYRKPMLLIPYVKGSRGDQVENAAQFEKAGYAHVLDERTATGSDFLQAITKLYADREAIVAAQNHFEFHDGVKTIMQLIEQDRLPEDPTFALR